MSFQRGFKTQANQIARDVRLELGLKSWEPLDPFALAHHLEIPVDPISKYHDEVPGAVKHFSGDGRSEFSAATIFNGTKRLIIHNDAHSVGRRNSNLAHELAHGLLLHPSAPALDLNGCRNWDKTIEMEADWLAGALLITDEAALKIVRDGLSISDAANIYGVTEKMLQFRLNVTAARKRIAWR